MLCKLFTADLIVPLPPESLQDKGNALFINPALQRKALFNHQEILQPAPENHRGRVRSHSGFSRMGNILARPQTQAFYREVGLQIFPASHLNSVSVRTRVSTRDSHLSFETNFFGISGPSSIPQDSTVMLSMTQHFLALTLA